ncbi:MAG: hypothetical protein AAGH15_20995 [Myxococcota bacterium]
MVARVLGGVLGVAYPVLVFFALREGLSARALGALALLFVLPLLALRLRRMPAAQWRGLLGVPLVITVLIALGAVLDDERFLFAMPVAISLGLLAVFAGSLRGEGPTTVESFARLVEPHMDAAKIAHCRQATIAWCVFFVVNAAIAGALALAGAREAWALYAGGIAYVAMGAMFAGEILVRVLRFGTDALRFRPLESTPAEAPPGVPE